MYGPTISSFPCNIVIPAQYRHSRAISSFPRNIVIPAQYRHSRAISSFPRRRGIYFKRSFSTKTFFYSTRKVKNRTIMDSRLRALLSGINYYKVNKVLQPKEFIVKTLSVNLKSEAATCIE